MTDHICGKPDITKIAGELNAGDGAAARSHINVCTVDLLNGNNFAKTDLGAIAKGDPTAISNAESNFSKLADQERNLWQSIRNAAHEMNPKGLCQLSIVEDKEQGPHAEINGAKCRGISYQLDGL